MRNFLKILRSDGRISGDSESFEELQQSGVDHRRQPRDGMAADHGPPRAVQVGNLLIQFHLATWRTRWRARACGCSRPMTRLREDQRLLADSPCGNSEKWPFPPSTSADARSRYAEAGGGVPLVYCPRLRRRARRRGRRPLPFHGQNGSRNMPGSSHRHTGCSGSDELHDPRASTTSSSTISNCSTPSSGPLRFGRPCRRRLDRRRAGGGAPSGTCFTMTLIGACGLFVAGQLIADMFMMPSRNTAQTKLRTLRTCCSPIPTALGERWFPDGRGDLDEELRRLTVDAALRFVRGFQAARDFPPRAVAAAYRRRCLRWVMWANTRRCRWRMVRPTPMRCPDQPLEKFAGAGHAVAVNSRACRRTHRPTP